MANIKNRQSNFELMRIISMLAIILWHIILHGNMINNCTNPAIKIILIFIQYLLLFHVNSFVLLSGYFQSKSKFKLSKFFDLLFQIIFYSTLIIILGIKFGIIKDYGITIFIKNLIPSSVNNYWFMKAYIVVYLLSNIINKFIESLSRLEYKRILIILFVIFSVFSFISGGDFFENTGYNFYNFIFLYLIGGYLRRYPIRNTYHLKKFSINGYRFLLMFIFISMIFLNYSVNSFAYEVTNYNEFFNFISSKLLYSNFSYSSPFVIVQTICYFLIFETFNFKNKFINLLSSCVFGVYLIHDNFYIRSNIYKFFQIDNGLFNNYSMLVRMVIVLIVIFIICVFIELIRKLLIKLIFVPKLTHKIISKLKAFINSFNFNLNW